MRSWYVPTERPLPLGGLEIWEDNTHSARHFRLIDGGRAGRRQIFLSGNHDSLLGMCQAK